MAILKVVLPLLLVHHSSASSMFKSPWSPSHHLDQLARMKRQALAPRNATDSDRDPDICVVKCLRAMEAKLGALQFDELDRQKQQSRSSPQSALNRDYDPKDFQKLCDAYRPGRDCLESCETTKLKTAAIKGMVLLQFMCVDKYEEFKANLPCMNNASAEAEVVCKPNCTEFEPAVNRLEQLSANRDLVINISQQALSRILAGSCLYVNCLGHCGNPITERRCGKKVAELDQNLVKQVFNSLRNTVIALGAGDQLPKECLKLSE